MTAKIMPKINLSQYEKKVDGAVYTDLRGAKLPLLAGVDLSKMEKLARMLRALIFAQVEAAQSGHPGSAGKVEQFLALVLGGNLAFDGIDPKNPGRDRLVWSAGHSSPLLYAGLSIIYESMRRAGRQFMPEEMHAILPEDLINFRRPNGPQGHIENYYPLSDYATGPSGHGLSAAVGIATTHHSCGLPTRVWTIMGDAESEEGMSYEARNLAVALGLDNLVVCLDYNHFGIDGPIEEVASSPYLNHWLGLGWNVVEVDGHDFAQLLAAYAVAGRGFYNHRPTVVIAHTLKGKGYGTVEGTEKAHGTPAAHEDYIKIIKKLGFDIVGAPGKVMSDIEKVFEQMNLADEQYISARLEAAKEKIKPESELVAEMKKKLDGRPLKDPRKITRPKKLPAELVFKAGEKVSLRKAVSAWCEWYMKQTAFFYTGAGDLSKSVLTGAAEKVYGVLSPENYFGRGIRYGIAEANMGMVGAAISQDILPGGFRPVSLFGTYAVFTAMMGNALRLAVINNHLNPSAAGFFVALASHDGLDTGEDGPTHQGLYWMSYFDALPGIKVYKPFDANEVIEMLFGALERGEPIVLAVPRNDMLVLKRSDVPDARAALDGAYVYKNYSNSRKPKKCLVVSGPQMLQNILTVLPDLEKKINIKIVCVTAPELFEDLRVRDPHKVKKIFNDKDREVAVTLHGGWTGWLDRFLLPSDELGRRIATDGYYKSGRASEVYELAGLGPDGIAKKILE